MKAIRPSLSFGVAAVLLAAACVLLYGPHRTRQQIVSTDVIPLRHPLTEFPAVIGPYERISEETLPANIERQLGTKDYIIWYYRDTRVPYGTPGSGFRLHVAYWSGTRQILSTGVHYPELCYVGGGAKTVDMQTREIVLQSPADAGGYPPLADTKIPLRLFQFYDDMNYTRRTVGYFFTMNGKRLASANYLRLATFLGPTRNVYYCKVEVTPGTLTMTPGKPGTTGMAGISDLDEARRFIQEFLGYALPPVEASLPASPK